MSNGDDEEQSRQRRVAEYAEQKARLERWRADPKAMRDRFRALVRGGPPDPEALLWADRVVHTAASASFKLWTMYVRRETETKAELDELIGLFREKNWQ